MADLPPDDQPDTFDIGPVKGIPIHYEDDPRLDAERATWSAATAKAQAMHSPDELLRGLRDEDWRVRLEVIDRLAVRAETDPRTPRALAQALIEDTRREVRAAVALAISRFPSREVATALRRALTDPEEDVRWSAQHSLDQLADQ